MLKLRETGALRSIMHKHKRTSQGMNLLCVEWSVFGTQNDQDQRSVEGSNFREFLQGRLKLPFKEGTKLEEDCPMLKLALKAEIGNEENQNLLCMVVNSSSDLKRRTYFGQGCSEASPCFPRGAGVFDHTSGTFFHCGIIDYPKIPVSEMHLGTFPDLWNFNAGMSTSRLRFCSKTADSNLTMQWSKEGEMAKSVDELMTSRSITGRTDFLTTIIRCDDCVFMENLLDRNVHFRRRVSVEEQRSQKQCRHSIKKIFV